MEMDGLTCFRRYQDVAAVEHDEAGKPIEGGKVRYATVTEAKPWSVSARFERGETRLFLLDSRDRAWCDGGRFRLVPLCRCEKPILGEPVMADDDPTGRQWCSEDCLTSAAEASQEQRYPSGVAT
jgi:hypothetical protein